MRRFYSGEQKERDAKFSFQEEYRSTLSLTRGMSGTEPVLRDGSRLCRAFSAHLLYMT
jgi:hypothetical protein